MSTPRKICTNQIDYRKRLRERKAAGANKSPEPPAEKPKARTAAAAAVQIDATLLKPPAPPRTRKARNAAHRPTLAELLGKHDLQAEWDARRAMERVAKAAEDTEREARAAETPVDTLPAVPENADALGVPLSLIDYGIRQAPLQEVAPVAVVPAADAGLDIIAVPDSKSQPAFHDELPPVEALPVVTPKKRTRKPKALL